MSFEFRQGKFIHTKVMFRRLQTRPSCLKKQSILISSVFLYGTGLLQHFSLGYISSIAYEQFVH